ncbi:MAG: LytR C-terminal domain-containing protein [Actinomycetota bacterium]|nr:LytR C-terminal domain-containing protein [Actinomycetota bacterium]
MDAPITPLETLVAPWRKATLVAAGIAIVELTLVVALIAVLVSREDGVAAVTAQPKADKHAAAQTLPRTKTRVLVLNGNGRAGAAGAMAEKLRGFTYRVAAVGNATRSDYGRSVVLYRPGRETEARRLARDLAIKLVGPLDGLNRGKLHGAHVALILGR